MPECLKNKIRIYEPIWKKAAPLSDQLLFENTNTLLLFFFKNTSSVSPFFPPDFEE